MRSFCISHQLRDPKPAGNGMCGMILAEEIHVRTKALTVNKQKGLIVLVMRERLVRALSLCSLQKQLALAGFF